MPLFLDSKILEQSVCEEETILTENTRLSQRFKDLADGWVSKPEKILGENVLYIAQREYGVIDPHSKGDIQYIATDSATTCHIVVLIQPETKVIGLGHFDGCKTEKGVHDLVKHLDYRCNQCSPGAPHRSYDVYIFGGFNDDQGTSAKLSKELLSALHSCLNTIHIKVLCVCNLNSKYEDGTCYPIYYGAGVDCHSLEIHRVQCTDKGPMKELKGSRNFIGPNQMVNTYDNARLEMVIEPFSYTQLFHQVELWLRQTDQFLLKHLSTSPEQEPADFVANTRQSLKFIADNPQPMLTVFNKGDTLRFTLISGFWNNVHSQ